MFLSKHFQPRLFDRQQIVRREFGFNAIFALPHLGGSQYKKGRITIQKGEDHNTKRGSQYKRGRITIQKGDHNTKGGGSQYKREHAVPSPQGTNQYPPFFCPCHSLIHRFSTVLCQLLSNHGRSFPRNPTHEISPPQKKTERKKRPRSNTNHSRSGPVMQFSRTEEK